MFLLRTDTEILALLLFLINSNQMPHFCSKMSDGIILPMFQVITSNAFKRRGISLLKLPYNKMCLLIISYQNQSVWALASGRVPIVCFPFHYNIYMNWININNLHKPMSVLSPCHIWTLQDQSSVLIDEEMKKLLR